MLIDKASGGRFRPNVEESELDLRTLSWRKSTNRNWPQFAIRPTDGKWFGVKDRPNFEAFQPSDLPHQGVVEEEWNRHRLVLDGETVKFTVDLGAVELLVEGTLPTGTLDRLIEAARQHVEAACHKPCIVDPY